MGHDTVSGVAHSRLSQTDAERRRNTHINDELGQKMIYKLDQRNHTHE